MGSFHFVPVIRSPTEAFDPVGRCIYCGAVGVPLTDEHIIPDGIGGHLVLPQASCGTCQDKIRPIEALVINSNFGLIRWASGLKSKKRRGKNQKRPTTYRTRTQENAEVEKPIHARMPATMLTFCFDDGSATLLTGRDPKDSKLVPSMTLSRLRRHDPDWITIPGPVRVDYFLRFLAKIAHAYACAIYGPTAFQHRLNTYIIDGLLDEDPHHFIGNRLDRAGKLKNTLHSLDGQRASVDTVIPPFASLVPKEWVVVQIHLFATESRTQAYEVVVGEWL